MSSDEITQPITLRTIVWQPSRNEWAPPTIEYSRAATAEEPWVEEAKASIHFEKGILRVEWSASVFSPKWDTDGPGPHLRVATRAAGVFDGENLAQLRMCTVAAIQEALDAGAVKYLAAIAAVGVSP